MRTAAFVLTFGAMLAAVSGCSSRQPAPASPPARLSPPIVGDPIDLSEFEKTPCGLMGPEQLAQFFISTPGAVSRVPTGLACTWTIGVPKPPTYQAAADISGGLEALYRRRSSIPVFEPATVHSHPAVHVGDDAHAEQVFEALHHM